jgi:DNA modification methylase
MSELKPDYQRDGMTLYLADCLDVLPHLTGIDAVITDPPYGIAHPCNFAARGRSNMALCNDYSDVIGDTVPFNPEPWLSFPKVVLWGANYFAEKLPPQSGWLVWDKERPDALDQATCELAWSNCVKGVRRFRHLWNGMMRASEHGENYHPMQKPAALMCWVLRLPWLLDSAAVLDPYMGCCPTGIACIRTGRKFIGIEKEPKYFEIARDRIDRELNQGVLNL